MKDHVRCPVSRGLFYDFRVDGQVTENREELPGDGDRITTVTLPDGSQVISEYEAGQQVKVERYDGETLLSRQSFTYDPHGRLATVTDEADGVTSYSYDAADRVIAVTTPDPDGEGPASPLVSQTVYDAMGRVSETIEPDSTSRYQTYHPTGEVARTWGTRTYPVEYAYEMGRLKTLTTWQDYTGETGAAVTTWLYDAERGWLNQKKYADDTGPVYTYTAGGRLASRTWARGVSTGYVYDYAGRLVAVNYSDSTADVAYSYDRLGRRLTTTDGTGVRTDTHDVFGRLQSESYGTGALLEGWALNHA